MVVGTAQATAGTSGDRKEERAPCVTWMSVTRRPQHFKADAISPGKTGHTTVRQNYPVNTLTTMGVYFINEQAKAQTGMSLLRAPDAGSRVWKPLLVSLALRLLS